MPAGLSGRGPSFSAVRSCGQGAKATAPADCFAEGRLFKNNASRGGANLSAPHVRSAGAHPGRRYSVLPECDRSVGATVPIGLSECGRSVGATLRRGASGRRYSVLPSATVPWCDCADWSVGVRSICRGDAPPGRIRSAILRAAGVRPFRGCDRADWSVGVRSICRGDASPGRIRSAILRAAGVRPFRGCDRADWSVGVRSICRGDASPGRIRSAILRAAGATGQTCVTARDDAARFVFGEKVVPLPRSGCGREQSPAQPPTSST